MSSATSKHVFHLANSKPFYKSNHGYMQRATADTFPILDGRKMFLKRLVLGPKAIREPHWHANTQELAYCISGSALVSITDDHAKFASFTIVPGQMWYVDSGSLHHIENLSDTEEAEFVICFRHERPQDFSFGASCAAMTPAVLGNTWNLEASELSGVRRSTEDKAIIVRDGPVSFPPHLNQNDGHRFDVEGTSPDVKGEVVEAHLAKQSTWPGVTSTSLAMYSLRVEDEGMREPHWHPITAEMGYVNKGFARMTIMDPDGSTDTYTLKPGDTYYIPPAYPHQIEVLPEGGDQIHFLIFFDQPMPQDIGFKSSVVEVPHEAMAATLGISRKTVEKFEGTEAVPLVVKRRNPVDSVQQWTQ